jgi:hypothetical protein
MSRPSTTPSGRDLGEEHQKTKRASQLPVLWHQSRVQFNDKKNALGFGQFLPIWDLKRWRLFQRFQAVSITAVLQGGKLVAQHARDNTEPQELLEAYLTFIKAQRRRGQGEQIQELTCDVHLREKLKSVRLGNCGGLRCVQPDHLPIGCLPMESRETWGGTPTFHYETQTMWDWVSAMRLPDGAELKLPTVITEKPREIGFFVRDGNIRGWDAQEQTPATFRQVPVPFSWMSAEELGLIHATDDVFDAVEDSARLALSLSAAVRRLSMREAWQGYLYVGFVEHPDTLPTEGLITKDEALDDGDGLGAIYEIPYQKDKPLSVLDYDPADKVRELRNGNTPRRALVLEEATAGSRYAELPERYF